MGGDAGDGVEPEFNPALVPGSPAKDVAGQTTGNGDARRGTGEDVLVTRKEGVSGGNVSEQEMTGAAAGETFATAASGETQSPSKHSSSSGTRVEASPFASESCERNSNPETDVEVRSNMGDLRDSIVLDEEAKATHVTEEHEEQIAKATEADIEDEKDDQDATPSPRGKKRHSAAQGNGDYGESTSKKKKKSAGTDILHDVLDAKGELAVGSQLSLTQADPVALDTLSDVLLRARGRDFRTTIEMHRENPLLADFVKTCFRGSPPGDRRGLERRVLLYDRILRLVARGYQNSRKASGLFSFLVTEIHSLPAASLASLAEKACDTLFEQQAIFGNPEEIWSPFELVPVLLVRVLELPRGSLDGMQKCRDPEAVSEMDGAQFSLKQVERVCAAEWPRGACAMIVSTLTEMSPYFSSQLAVKIVDKALSQCLSYSDSPEALPPLIKAVLQLITSCGSIKPGVAAACLDKLVAAVESASLKFIKDKKTSDDLSQVGKQGSPPDGDPQDMVDGATQDASLLKPHLEAQGAIISSFCLVMSNDLALGRAFITSCLADRGGLGKLSAFRAGLLMGLARVRHLEPKVTEVFISRAKSAAMNARRASKSHFLAEILSKPEGRGVGGAKCTMMQDCLAKHAGMLDAVFRDVVRYSKIGGWDAVVQSFAPLGIKMTDCFNTYGPARRIERDVRYASWCSPLAGPEEREQDGEIRVSTQAEEERRLLEAGDPNATVAALGLQLLSDSFCAHSIVQRDLLEYVRLRVLGAAAASANDREAIGEANTKNGTGRDRSTASKAVGAASMEGVFQTVRLVAVLADRVPYVLLDSVTIIKDILTGLPKIAPRAACGLLQALQPLLALRADLVDFGVLVFRKALFQRDLQPRLVAVYGLLVMVRNVAHARSHTSGSSNVAGANGTSSGRAEQQADIINSVNRCFTHQPLVRASVYAGLGALYQSSDMEPSVNRIIVEMLLSHLDSLLVSPMTDEIIKQETAKGTLKSKYNSAPASQMDASQGSAIDQRGDASSQIPQSGVSGVAQSGLSGDGEDTDDERDAFGGQDGMGVHACFPFALIDRCLDRPGGTVCEPLPELLMQIVAISKSKSFGGHVSRCILSELSQRVARCDVDDLLAVATNSQELAVLAANTCEQLLSFRFDSQVWQVQQRLIRCLAGSSARHSLVTDMANNDEVGSVASKEKEKHVQHKLISSNAVSSAASVAKFPSSFSLFQLVSFLQQGEEEAAQEDDDDDQEIGKDSKSTDHSTSEKQGQDKNGISTPDHLPSSFLSFAAGHLPVKCASLREIRRIIPTATASRALGVEKGLCSQAAMLCGKGAGSGTIVGAQDGRAVVLQTGLYLASMIFNDDPRKLCVSALTALKECIAVAVETDYLGEFLEHSLGSKKLAVLDQNHEEGQESSDSDGDDENGSKNKQHGARAALVDISIRALQTRVVDRLMDVSKDKRGGEFSNNTVFVAFECMSLLMPFSQKPKPHAKWLRDAVLASDSPLRNNKNVGIVVQLHLFSEQAASKTGHSIDAIAALVSALAKNLAELDDSADEREGGGGEDGEDGAEDIVEAEGRTSMKRPREHGKNLLPRLFQDNTIASALVLGLCKELNTIYEECEWAFAVLRDDPLGDTGDGVSGGGDDKDNDAFQLAFDPDAASRARSARREQDRLLCSKLSHALRAMLPLVSQVVLQCVPREKCIDAVFRSVLRHYKLLALYLKCLHLTRPKSIAQHVAALLERTRRLTRQVYDLMSLVAQQDGGAGATGTNNASTSGSASEARLIPNLVYHLEQYNVFLIKVAKSTKLDEISLTRMMVASLNRDFKIRDSSKDGKKRKKKKGKKRKLNNPADKENHGEQET